MRYMKATKNRKQWVPSLKSDVKVKTTKIALAPGLKLSLYSQAHNHVWLKIKRYSNKIQNEIDSLKSRAYPI